MSSSLGLRFFRISQRASNAAARIPIRKPLQRRFQSTEVPPSSSSSSSSAAAGSSQSAFQRLWNSPVGAKTVHFWAPVMKWALVLAGISDFWRPAENLSLTQNLALTATGIIWTRWCFVIKPKNMLLAAVNFFLACVGITQLSRILLYQRSVKNGDTAVSLKEDARDLKDSAVAVASETKTAVREAIK